MELFNEIFSRNYIEVTKLLNKIAENNGIKKTDLNLENTTITCKKLTDDIMLIKKSDNGCVSVRGHQPKLRRPLTRLELSWLKSVCADEKAGLFLNNDEIKKLSTLLKDVEPLYGEGDFRYFDTQQPDEPYSDNTYREIFRKLLKAIKRRHICDITFNNGGSTETARLQPCHLLYSLLDGSFALRAVTPDEQLKIIGLRDISAVSTVRIGQVPPVIEEKNKLVAEIDDDIDEADTRNAVERFMICFSNYRKESTYLTEPSGKRICRTTVYFNDYDYETIVRRVISFGSVVKVISPQRVIDDIVERLKKQKQLFEGC